MSALTRTTFPTLFHDSILDDFFGDVFGHNLRGSEHRNTFMNVARHPISTKRNEDGSITLLLDVPGCDKEDLEINFNEETAVLSVSSNTNKETDTALERRSFSYQYRLKGFDPGSMTAECKKGVLTFSASLLPKKENIRTIEIK